MGDRTGASVGGQKIVPSGPRATGGKSNPRSFGPTRLGHLLQGLACCAICRYAYYGKTTRERGPEHSLKDYRYYRCTGTDGYRFGGERICANRQIQAEFLEAAVWREVCDLLRNPEKLERDFKESDNALASLETAEVLKAQRLKQQHVLERLIDSFTEGLISKDQFTSRMSRTRSRIAELDAEIQAYSGDIDQMERRRLAGRGFVNSRQHLGWTFRTLTGIASAR